MPDVYAAITEADPTVQGRLADILELRAANPQQRAMLEAYLAEVKFPEGARVLEIGCGTGPVSRHLSALVRSVGFHVVRLRSHGYVETAELGYMVTLVDRDADVLVASGRIGIEKAEAFKAEARRRIDAGEFFGHIAYASLIAQKPAS